MESQTAMTAASPSSRAARATAARPVIRGGAGGGRRAPRGGPWGRGGGGARGGGPALAGAGPQHVEEAGRAPRPRLERNAVRERARPHVEAARSRDGA